MAQRHTATSIRVQGSTTSTEVWSADLASDVVKSARVSGAVVNIGGKIFRKATPYAVRHYKTELGSPQATKALWKNGSATQPVTIQTTPGGLAPDIPARSTMYAGWTNPNTGMQNCGSFPTIPSSMENEAVTKALLDLLGQSAQLGEDMATFGQTMRMLANPTQYLAHELKMVWSERQFRPFLRRTVDEIKKMGPSDVASRYLEYVYGWRPLMSEIHTLYRMARDTTAKPLLVHGRGTSSRYASHPVTQYVSGTATTMLQVNSKSTVRCNIWARVDPNDQGIRSLNQLGLANPQALAWELMSWSFVIDWVLPIGAVLNALTATKGLIFFDGSVANRLKANGTYNQVRNADSKDTDVSHMWATGMIRYNGYTRKTLGSFPKPGLWLDADPLRGDRPFKAAALAVLALGSLR